MFTTVPVFKQCTKILMESTPDGLRADQVRESIIEIDGVVGIDDFHCWSIAGGKNVATVSIKLNHSDQEMNDYKGFHKIHNKVKKILKKHDICHSNI